MANRKTRSGLDRSNRSERSFIAGEAESEHFWSIELNADKRSYTWSSNIDLEDDDEDFVIHTLFLRQSVLGAGSVPNEQNVVTLESMGAEGENEKGAIINLTKGVNSMCPLELTIQGKSGATFTLAEGNGPIYINGAHLLEFPKEDEFKDNSQTESELSEDLDEEDEEDQEVELRPVKRKGAKLTNGNEKQKAKVVEEMEDEVALGEEDEEEDDEDEEDEDFDEEEESDESPKAKKSKKKVTEIRAKKVAKEVKKPTKRAKAVKK